MATQWSRRQQKTAVVFTSLEHVDMSLRAGKFRVGQEQLTRVMVRFKNALGYSDRLYKHCDALFHGRSESHEAASVGNP